MRVLVSGGTGFLGSYLCRELLRRGHQVAVLTRSPEKAWRLAESGNITWVRGGLEDLTACQDDIQAFAPHAVAHLGWLGVANFDRNNPVQVKNLLWSADLLQMCKTAGASTFLALGSQAEYGPKHHVIAPDTPTAPTTLYGKVKLATAEICGHIAALNDMRFVWMRVFSTYGAKDHPYWMIPGLIRDLLSGKRPALTKGEQRWDFLHAADAASAMSLALENDAAQGVYTLGSGNAPPLKQTIETIRDLVDPSLPLGFGEIPYRPDQVMILQADIGRLVDDLGWRPYVDLRTGLESTVKWYAENRWIFEQGSQ